MRKVFVIFAFPAIALFFSFDLSAQSRTSLRKGNVTVAARSNAVVSELDQQRSFLQKVTSRYEAVSITEFTPYFSYTYVWKALKENRDEILQQSKSLTPAQLTAVKKGYAVLEQDVMQGFVAQQLNVLTSELDLNEFQAEEVEKLLSKDLEQKRSLLSAHGLTQEAFTRRIVRMSEATEKQILAIFFPEQEKDFGRK